MRQSVVQLLFCIAAVAGSPALAQGVSRPLLAIPMNSLQFPKIAIAGTGSGSATIDPITDSISSSGAVHIFSGAGGAATMQIVGTPGTLFSVRPPSIVHLIAPSGEVLQLRNLTSTAQNGVRLNPAGLAQVRIGGTIAILPSTLAGTYRGRALIAVDYLFE
jgi:Domain of unknown function (DUF4402)